MKIRISSRFRYKLGLDLDLLFLGGTLVTLPSSMEKDMYYVMSKVARESITGFDLVPTMFNAFQAIDPSFDCFETVEVLGMERNSRFLICQNSSS